MKITHLLLLPFIFYYVYKGYKKFHDRNRNNIISKYDNIYKKLISLTNSYDSLNYIYSINPINNMMDIDRRISYSTHMLHFFKYKLCCYLCKVNVNKQILNFIKKDVTKDEYKLIEKFLIVKNDIIYLFRNIYFVNKYYDVHFHIVNESQNKDNIVFTYID